MTPKQVVEKWVALFNAGDAESIAALYRLDATNHQVNQDPISGRQAIRAMFEQEFLAAKMVCLIEDIHVSGNVIALEWRDALGLRGCGFFTIENELIKFQRGYSDMLSFLRMHGLPINENT